MKEIENSKQNDYILEGRNLIKRFGGVCALDNVSLQLKKQEILGLVGDNGAGKSTLIKILSGAILKDFGEIYFNNQKIEINRPVDAINLGIFTVYQDLALEDMMDLPSNIFLGRELRVGKFFTNKAKMYDESIKLMKKLNIDIDNYKKDMLYYSGGQRQAVSLSKAFYWGKQVVILDEPTAALGQKEASTALTLIKKLKEYGLSIIIISHNLQHVFSLVDRIMILRRGKVVGIKDANNTTAKEIVTLITGAEEYYERV